MEDWCALNNVGAFLDGGRLLDMVRRYGMAYFLDDGLDCALLRSAFWVWYGAPTLWTPFFSEKVDSACMDCPLCLSFSSFYDILCRKFFLVLSYSDCFEF